MIDWSYEKEKRYWSSTIKKRFRRSIFWRPSDPFPTNLSRNFFSFDSLSLEILSKSRQAWGAGRTGPIGSAPVKTTKADRKALEKAEKEGRLAEEMLDRRAKKKSDKFAKVSRKRRPNDSYTLQKGLESGLYELQRWTESIYLFSPFVPWINLHLALFFTLVQWWVSTVYCLLLI